MKRVVVERSFDEPARVAELSARERAWHGSSKEGRVEWIKSFVSGDGRRMICVYHAPDAEAVRSTQDQVGLPYDGIWSGDLVEPDRAPERREGFSLVLVERELPPGTTRDAYEALSAKASGCLRSHRVNFVESVFGGQAGFAVCAFYAPDAEAVRIANLESGLPLRRAWSCRVLAPDGAASP